MRILKGLLPLIGLIGILFVAPGMLPGIIPDLGGFVSGCSSPGPGHFNPCDKSEDIALSNDDLTATRLLTHVNTWKSGRSTTSHSSGKYYLEITISLPDEGQCIDLGFANASAPLSDYVGSDANGIGAICNGQVVQSGVGTFPGNIETFDTGDIIDLALDIDNQKFWVRIDRSSGLQGWNFDAPGSPNPATNTGGISLPSGLASGPIFAALSLYAQNLAGTANFGATAFAQTPPAGFSPWG